MARGGDDAEAEALQVVVGARELGELVLAAVAGAGVDMADCEAATAPRLRQVDCSCGGGGGRGAGSASAVHAGVAELEALVDQREVREQVVGRGVGDDRPVRVGAGAKAQAFDPVAAPLDDAARRPARAFDPADTDRVLLRRPARHSLGESGGRAARRGSRTSARARAPAARNAPARRRPPAPGRQQRSPRRRGVGCSRARPA